MGQEVVGSSCSTGNAGDQTELPAAECAASVTPRQEEEKATEAADADADLLLGVRHLVSRVCEHRGGDEGATPGHSRNADRRIELRITFC